MKHVEEATTLNLQNPAQHWPYLEASLYVWSAVAESLAEEEDECPILTQFLAKLPTLPYNNNMKVISSALDCIGGKSIRQIIKILWFKTICCSLIRFRFVMFFLYI